MIEIGNCGIRCRELVKNFGSGEAFIRVLDEVNMDAPPGKITCIMGPSGCGKTTLLSCLSALLKPDGGQVRLLHLDPMRASDEEIAEFRRINIGFVFQQFNLLAALTIEENVAVPLILQGVGRKRAAERGRRALEELGLRRQLGLRPRQLSGGQQQRVAIARALVHEPKLVVCDEPTASLDADAGATVLRLLRDVAASASRTVIVVSHDPKVANISDRILVMRNGKTFVSEREPMEVGS